MIIDLESYRNKKQDKTIEFVSIPVFDRIYVEDGKVIGELEGSGRKVIIEDYSKGRD